MVSGSASRSLARELARTLEADLVEAEVNAFADGELYVRVPEDLRGEHVVLVQTSYPNERLVELFLLQDAVAGMDPAGLTVVVPYFAYARQDKKFKEGEAVSSRAVARRISLEADRVLTVDIHDQRVMDYFAVPARNLSGIPALARRFRELGTEMVLAPDENAARHAKRVGELTDVPWDFLKKERLDSWTVETEAKRLAVEGLRVAIVDDVISTGGTMVSAARIVQEQGAAGLVAGCVHGLFVGDARRRLKVFDEVVATDTVLSDHTQVSVAPEVAEGLRKTLTR